MPKTNKFAFMQYEESNPLSKVLDFLTTNHFAAVISPLHDSDTWTPEEVERWRDSQWKLHNISIPEGATEYARPTGELRKDKYGAAVPVTEMAKVPQVGELKKPHRHVYIEFDYSKPLETAIRDLSPLNINYLEVINSRRGYLRYLCHLDTPEKTKYDITQVISLGGVDISCLWTQDEAERYEQDGNIYALIRKHRIHSLNALIALLVKLGKRQMYNEVKSHSGYWVQYLRGAYYVVDTSEQSEGDIQDDMDTTEDTSAA